MTGSMRTFVTDRLTDGAGYIGPEERVQQYLREIISLKFCYYLSAHRRIVEGETRNIAIDLQHRFY